LEVKHPGLGVRDMKVAKPPLSFLALCLVPSLTWKYGAQWFSGSFPNWEISHGTAQSRTRNREFPALPALERSFVEVNEKICRARPAEDAFTPEEKNGRVDPG
jgi:hypothetical protein